MVDGSQMVLLDSGGQYESGTTDVRARSTWARRRTGNVRCSRAYSKETLRWTRVSFRRALLGWPSTPSLDLLSGRRGSTIFTALGMASALR